MVPITARPKAQRCVRRRTRASYLPVGRTWRHAGAATEVLEAVPPLGIAAPAPKRSTTQPILASRAHLESPMGTTCPPPPPWLQASRSMTTRDEPGCPSRRPGAAGCRRIRIRPMKCLHLSILSIFDASERSDRVARRPHKYIRALRALISVRAPIWRRSCACWAEFEAGVTPLPGRELRGRRTSDLRPCFTCPR